MELTQNSLWRRNIHVIVFLNGFRISKQSFERHRNFLHIHEIGGTTNHFVMFHILYFQSTNFETISIKNKDRAKCSIITRW